MSAISFGGYKIGERQMSFLDGEKLMTYIP